MHDVAKGIGLDGRIGSKFLHPGPGYGGSCFPKDTLALVRVAEEAGAPTRLIETTVQVNDMRKRKMATRVVDASGGSVAGKRIGVLGVTFKPNTDDMRDSPSLTILPRLKDLGATVVAYDPQGRREGEPMLPGVEWAEGPYDVAENADVLLLLTEWNEFRALDLERIAKSMRGNVLVDLRNVYNGHEASRAGLAYHSIGRQAALVS